jgi:hypothetical protein
MTRYWSGLVQHERAGAVVSSDEALDQLVENGNLDLM